MGHDLRRFYAFRLLATSYLWVPVFVAFMRSRGLDFDHIALLHALYSVVVILVEVPTGALADRIGRRHSLMLGALAMVASCLVAYHAYTFTAFALAEVLAAVSMALCSGADSAYLFDLLKRNRCAEQYPQRESTASAWHQAGSGLACAAGGFLGYFVELSFPYLATAAVSATAFAIATRMRAEPPAAKSDNTATAELREYLRHMGQSVRDVAQNRQLAWTIAYSAVVFVLLRSTVVLYQPYLEARGFLLWEIGLIYAASFLLAAVAARRFHTVRHLLGEDTLVFGLLATLAISFLLLSQLGGEWAPLSMFALQAVANGLYSPLAKTMLNRSIDSSERRATVLSVESIARRMALGLFWPIAGWAGAHAALYVCAGLGIAGFIVLAIVALRWRIRLDSVHTLRARDPMSPTSAAADQQLVD